MASDERSRTAQIQAGMLGGPCIAEGLVTIVEVVESAMASLKSQLLRQRAYRGITLNRKVHCHTG